MTADEMTQIDRIAMEQTGPNLYQMMENAGRSLAVTAIEMLGDDWQARPVVVLAGTGGNGGGGICAARHLANLGVNVTLSLVDESRLAEVPAQQLAVYRHGDGEIVGFHEDLPSDTSLIVDALVGYSLAGKPRGTIGDMIRWIASAPAPVLSLDIPSGIDATTGEAPGVHVDADTTLTLALPKTGLAAEAVGRLLLTDIGIPRTVYRLVEIDFPAEVFGAKHIIELSTETSP